MKFRKYTAEDSSYQHNAYPHTETMEFPPMSRDGVYRPQYESYAVDEYGCPIPRESQEYYSEMDMYPSLAKRLFHYFIVDNIKYAVVMVVLGLIISFSTPHFPGKEDATYMWLQMCSPFILVVIMKSWWRTISPRR